MDKLIASSKPNLIIHSAAQRFPDQMEKEPEKSWKLNVDTTQHLAQVITPLILRKQRVT